MSGPSAIQDKSDCRMGPGKFQIRSAGRLERIGKIIFAIVRHIFRNFTQDGPQSWMRSNRINSSLFIMKENISLYLGNFIPPHSEHKMARPAAIWQTGEILQQPATRNQQIRKVHGLSPTALVALAALANGGQGRGIEN